LAHPCGMIIGFPRAFLLCVSDWEIRSEEIEQRPDQDVPPESDRLSRSGISAVCPTEYRLKGEARNAIAPESGNDQVEKTEPMDHRGSDDRDDNGCDHQGECNRMTLWQAEGRSLLLMDILDRHRFLGHKLSMRSRPHAKRIPWIAPKRATSIPHPMAMATGIRNGESSGRNQAVRIAGNMEYALMQSRCQVRALNIGLIWRDMLET
jgi:hypothetical protein